MIAKILQSKHSGVTIGSYGKAKPTCGGFEVELEVRNFEDEKVQAIVYFEKTEIRLLNPASDEYLTIRPILYDKKTS